MSGQPWTNTGHGHVWPRPDGVKARCGGPPICRECAIDARKFLGIDRFEKGLDESTSREQLRTEIKPLVLADIEARVAKGTKEYGEPLTSHNGRDALWDAYEEALDLAMYLRQAIAERDHG